MISKLQLNKSSIISKHENEKGIVLIGAIALIAILALLGTVGVITTTTEIIISKNHKTSVQARYITEAGIHRTIGMLNSSPGWLGDLADPTINAFPGDNSFGNGTYVVKVFEDDPTPGKIRINTTGSVNGSSSTFEAIVTSQYYKILDYATFDCGTITLKGGETNIISGGDVFVSGNLDLEATGVHQIQNGDVYAMGDININGSSSIIGGSAFANGKIDVLSSASLNIDGNATAAGTVSGSGTVSGTISQGVTPDPVTNQCSATYLPGITITSEDIEDFRDNANITISGAYTFDSGDNYTGIVHITGDFELEEDATFSGNVIYIVDGNAEISASLTSSPPGYTVTFLVPTGDFEVKGSGSVTIDGTLLVGTIDSDGSSPTGGNIDVKDGSDLTVNGSLIAVSGNTDASLGGALIVTYQSPVDSNLTIQGSYTMTQWREIRN
jgi:hypothetical protein